MTTVRTLTRGALALAFIGAAAPLAAQGTGTRLDRTVQPTPGPAPTLAVPKWTSTRLSNGAELIVTEKHDLPLVSFSINFIGGTSTYEAAEKAGVGSFTASMLREGTTSKTGEQLADAMQMLGTSIGVGVGAEGGVITFTALKDKFEPALALAMDMLLNPTFPAEALERLRAQRLVSLAQAKEQPNSIASTVFSKVVYGDTHPYGRVVTEESVRAITRDDILAFHRAYFRPGRAVISVAGDIQPAQARQIVERAMASWPAGGERPAFDYPQPPASRETTIYLVDKPGSAQSVFSLGIPGPARDTPDYYALTVMNHILGGLFQSRLNHNIREVRGWSYGVGSDFAFGRGPGPFQAGGGIVTAKTDSALLEFISELRGVQGSRPFTADEIRQGKESLIQGLPRRFASVNATASAISSLYTQGLPETYYQDYAAKINAVTAADLERVAKKYIDMNRLNIIIVGDRAKIEEPLRRTGIAPIIVTDIQGKPIPVP